MTTATYHELPSYFDRFTTFSDTVPPFDEPDAIPDVPDDLIEPCDYEFDDRTRMDMRTTQSGYQWGAYSDTASLRRIMSNENAARRLGVAGHEELGEEVWETLRARQLHQGVVAVTPLIAANHLVRGSNATVFLKNEGAQNTGSYKLRGAYNAVIHQPREKLVHGIVTRSSGNHGPALAHVGQLLGYEVTVCLPENTPEIKVQAVDRYDGNLLVGGSSFQDTEQVLEQYLEQNPDAVVVHPFNDKHVVYGQGTLAPEILEQLAELGETPDVLLVPVGGGGVLAGVAQYMAQVSPRTKVIGVENEGATALTEALEAGYPVMLDDVCKLAEGTAVQQVGDYTFAQVQKYAAGTLVVDRLDLAEAWVDLENSGITTEGSGALALAGIRRYLLENTGFDGVIAGILTGSNRDDSKVRAARAMLRLAA